MDNLIASVTASFSSVLAFTPLESIRTLQQIQTNQQPIQALVRQVVQQSGFKSLYRGVGMNLVSTTSFNSIFLGIYDYLKQNQINKLNNNNNLQFEQIAGITVIAGVASKTATNPLYTVQRKLQASILEQDKKKSTIMNQIQLINNKFGYRGYFKGLGFSYLGLSHGLIYFGLYEVLKNKVQQYRNYENQSKLSTFEILSTSSLAKLAAIIGSYPPQLLSTQLQVQENNLKLNILGMIKNLYKTQGFKGFFNGMNIEIARALPANALTFIVYEKVKQMNLNDN